MTGDIANIFLPYFLLLFFVFLGCMCYRLAIPFSFHRIFGTSSSSSSIPRLRETAARHRYFPRLTRGRRSGREITSALPLPLTDENSIRMVESLLHENLNRASIAEREARRLATILANTRGISAQEYLETSRRHQEDTLSISAGPPSTTPVGMNFMPTQFYDDFELLADMPPTYEECLTTTNRTNVSIPMEVDVETTNSNDAGKYPSQTEPEPIVKTP